jgi:hypothetical protein
MLQAAKVGRERAETMKTIVQRLWFAAAITFLAIALVSGGNAQHADQDASPVAPQNSNSPSAAHQRANEPQIPASGEATTQEAKSFTGSIVKENSELMLRDTVTKVSYKLDDPAKAKPYIGKRVKVVGKLDMDTNTIRVESIAVSEGS